MQRKRFNNELKQALAIAKSGRCMYCGRRPGIDLLDIDHKKPLAKGGSNNKRNLQLLCRTCNNRKGTKTDMEFRRMYKELGIPQTQQPPA